MRYLGFGFMALVFLEGMVFLALLPVLGFFWILLLWIMAGFAGTALVRMQGLAMLMQTHRAMGTGAFDGRKLLSDLAIILAGFLLIMPGFLSDLLAAVVLVPRLLNGWRPAHKSTPVHTPQSTTPYASNDTVIDAEYTVIETRDDPKS